MRLSVRPGGTTRGTVAVPGDKSIAHRWLILAAISRGPSRLRGVPASLDVLSTAGALGSVLPDLRPQLEVLARNSQRPMDGRGFTSYNSQPRLPDCRLEGLGRAAVRAPGAPIDCGNSGTTMRLLSGLLASAGGIYLLVGDASLSRRPMERVARPLREMGAEVRTTDGLPPVVIEGRRLRGADVRIDVPSAQVKGSVLLAGIAASGVTRVLESVATRDHTERALAALGAPVRIAPGDIRVEAWEPTGLSGTVPGDISGAAFLFAAALATGGSVTVEGVGLNPTRTHVLEVVKRMGAAVDVEVLGEELGEPVGAATIGPGSGLRGVAVTAEELPGVIDEVPALAALATLAEGETRFKGAGELRVKESDRLTGLAAAIREAGGDAEVEGDELVVAGGGLRGGTVNARGDHRLAMAFAAVGAASERGVTIADASAVPVSFPGFPESLRALGLDVEG